MSFRSVGIVVLVLASITTAAPARAECVSILGKQMLKGRDVVFSGTVVHITRIGDAGYRATFEVDRVWKGSVSKRFDLYVWGRSAEMPRFEAGKRYLALADKLTDPEVRRALGLAESETVAFRAGLCTGEYSPTPETLRDMGPGKPPKESTAPRRVHLLKRKSTVTC
jgi:hypothetical protein